VVVGDDDLRFFVERWLVYDVFYACEAFLHDCAALSPALPSEVI
jgi:hypothetical protein